jgi:DNA-binding transcriptional regulator WhiA
MFAFMEGAEASFANDVKHELALQLPARACCQLSELEGLLASAPAARGGRAVSVRLAGNIAARKAVRLARLLDGGDPPRGSGHFRRGPTHSRPSYIVSFRTEADGPLSRLMETADPPTRGCCRRAFLRGAFLAGGSVSVAASGYHLELTCATAEGAAAVEETMAAVGLQPGRRQRGRRHLLYLKGSDQLATMLKVMGASHAVLRFENDRIVRELRAEANRQANTETANLRRVVDSSLRQVTAARRLTASGVLQTQPLALREIASMRLSMPSASLAQLAFRLSLSKSAVNARLRRLLAVADEAGLVDLARSRTRR